MENLLSAQRASINWLEISTSLKKPIEECKTVWNEIVKNNQEKYQGIIETQQKNEKQESPVHKLKRNESWTEEEDKTLFELYKKHGSSWTLIASAFHGKSESNVKNRFYSTLRRITRMKLKECKNPEEAKECKQNILNYVDEAINYGHNCFNKRGRPKKSQEIPEDSQRPISEVPQDLPPPLPVLPKPEINLTSPTYKAVVSLAEPRRNFGNESLSGIHENSTTISKEVNDAIIDLLNAQQKVINLLFEQLKRK